jgi:hypothetical protein
MAQNTSGTGWVRAAGRGSAKVTGRGSAEVHTVHVKKVRRKYINKESTYIKL